MKKSTKENENFKKGKKEVSIQTRVVKKRRAMEHGMNKISPDKMMTPKAAPVTKQTTMPQNISLPGSSCTSDLFPANAFVYILPRPYGWTSCSTEVASASTAPTKDFIVKVPAVGGELPRTTLGLIKVFFFCRCLKNEIK